jgi:hypothetical protein
MLPKPLVTIDEDAVVGRAFVDAIDQLEKVDALIAGFDHRRDTVLREIGGRVRQRGVIAMVT